MLSSICSTDNQSAGPSSILLDPAHVTGQSSLHDSHPSPDQIDFLWTSFVKNVHPMVKIFFAWEQEPIVRRAAQTPQHLTQAEETLVFAIYFISIISLTNDECSSVMVQSKMELLDNIQPVVETSLLKANFISTSKLIVLQAFLLYLVRSLPSFRPWAYTDEFSWR